MPAKLTLKEIQLIANKRGGKCLSEKYINNATYLKFKCENEHIWNARPDKIKLGQWCPNFPCNKSTKGTIQRMQELAKKIDKYGKGKCLSTKYVNTNTKLLWKCGDDTHPSFEKKPVYVGQGHWCEKCGGSEKGTIDKAHAGAKKRGGKCLSLEYKNAYTPLLWECMHGHQWSSKPTHIINKGSWCPYCAKNAKLTIEEMQDLAEKRGGKCISKKYKNDSTKLVWKCLDKTHPSWQATPNSVKSGKWCIKCAGKDKGTIKKMQEIAKKRNGKCISTNYINSESKLKWQCNREHLWESTPHSIKAGQWCPDCAHNNSRGEQICREYFEQLFQEKFIKLKPAWLKNERTKGKLQLDGFSEKLSLAFEHQGRQHDEFIAKKFHKTEEDFLLGKENDKIKIELCEKNNITLILIPEIPNKIKIEELKEFIKSECLRVGYPIHKNFDNIEISKIKNYYKGDELKLKECKNYANKKGGKCLTEKYLGANVPLKWQCENGHEWTAKPNQVLNRETWCPKCGGREKKTLQEIQEFANARNLKCLSDKYIRATDIMKWECKVCAHSFEKSYFKVFSSPHSCSICFPNIRKLGNIEEMKKGAKEKWNGRCLSDVYINSTTKLEWKCEKSAHPSFLLKPNGFKTGNWCPKCGTEEAWKKRKNNKVKI